MRVRYTARARTDLGDILEYIDRRSPPGAKNVKFAIKKTMEFIGWYPHGGRMAGLRDTRVLPVGRYPYLIYWSVRGGEVWVIHIRHAARRPWEGD
jgi:toxin ParE1/3/4